MVKTNKVTNLNIAKNKAKENSKVSALSPREIVSELDRYVMVTPVSESTLSKLAIMRGLRVM